MKIEDLELTFVLLGDNCISLKVVFEGVQSYTFVPDDLVDMPEDVHIDALQAAPDKHWIEKLRVSTPIHRAYLERHNFYILHATDVGLLEIVAASVKVDDRG